MSQLPKGPPYVHQAYSALNNALPEAERDAIEPWCFQPDIAGRGVELTAGQYAIWLATVYAEHATEGLATYLPEVAAGAGTSILAMCVYPAGSGETRAL
jgi:hypothetical protein